MHAHAIETNVVEGSLQLFVYEKQKQKNEKTEKRYKAIFLFFCLFDNNVEKQKKRLNFCFQILKTEKQKNRKTVK